MGGFSSAREMEKVVLPETALMELKPREFVAFIYEESYMGYTADISPYYLNIIMPELKRKSPSTSELPSIYQDLYYKFKTKKREKK